MAGGGGRGRLRLRAEGEEEDEEEEEEGAGNGGEGLEGASSAEALEPKGGGGAVHVIPRRRKADVVATPRRGRLSGVANAMLGKVEGGGCCSGRHHIGWWTRYTNQEDCGRATNGKSGMEKNSR